LILIVFVVVLFQPSAEAQLRIAVGGTAGGGYLKGNSPSVGAFTTSLFVETSTVLFEEVFPRFSFVYVKDIDALLPNKDKPYFPSVLGFTFKGITTQYFENKIFLEEGVGLLALNDQTFSDTDSWDYGIVLSINGGFDLRGFNLDGFKLGAGAEYGITFFDTLPQYSSVHIFIHYTY
jgi:hypothetical protein